MEFENQLKIGIGIYTPTDISQILRIPYHRVTRWIDNYWDGKLGKEFEARYSWKTDNSKAVSFHTLVEFYIMMRFSEVGIKTKNILQAHKELSIRYDTAFPFAHKEILSGMRTDTKKIYFINGDSTITLDGTRQFNLRFINIFFKNLDFNSQNLASHFWPMGKEKSILIDPHRKFGHPIVDGSNIYPETIHNLFLGGDSLEYISYLYEIPIKQVSDAIEYCEAA